MSLTSVGTGYCSQYSCDGDDETQIKMEQVVFVNKPAAALMCRRCRNLLVEPRLSIVCGHSFCKVCMDTKDAFCEVDSSRVNIQSSVPNHALSKQLNDLLVYCRFAKFSPVNGNSGEVILDSSSCTFVCPFSERMIHERGCQFADVACPFSKKCAKVSRRELATHIERCEFRGQPIQTDFDMQLVAFQTAFANVSEHLAHVTQRIAQLESENEALEKLLESAPAVEENFKQVQEVLVMPFYFLCTGTFRGHNGPVWVLHADGDFLVTAGSDQLIKLWDLNTFDCVKTLEGHEGVVHSLVVAQNRIYSGDSLGTLRVWDFHTLQSVTSCKINDSIICALAFCNGNIFIASFATIEILSADTLECVRTVSGLDHWVRALLVDDKTSRVYAACHANIYVFNAVTLEMVTKISTQFGSIHSMTLTAKYLITGTYNQNIHLYDIETLRYSHNLWGHMGIVTALGTSVSGQFLFSGSLDSTIKIWNLENRLVVQTLQRHDATVSAVVWHRNMLFSAGSDEAVKMFKFCKGTLRP